MRTEKGFSLVELLVVVIIIAIIAALAIPRLLASRRAANEASAVNTLRTYRSAETTYQSTVGGSVSYGNETDLAGIVDSLLAGDDPTKSGYNFALEVGGTGNSSFCVTATPAIAGATGSRVFAVSINGVIYASAPYDGSAYPNAPSCSSGALTVNGAQPIQ